MKKQTHIFLFVFIILTVSCKKDTVTTINLNVGDYFIFGEYAGECFGDCAHFYLIKDNNLYADLNDYFFTADSLKFNSTLLSSAKYDFAKPLLTDFPGYLMNHKNETFGCPDCTDSGAVYIILKKDGIISKWNIDNYITNQPDEIKEYISQIHSVIHSLE